MRRALVPVSKLVELSESLPLAKFEGVCRFAILTPIKARGPDINNSELRRRHRFAGAISIIGCQSAGAAAACVSPLPSPVMATQTVGLFLF